MKKILLIVALLVVAYLFVNRKGRTGSTAPASGNTDAKPKGTPEQTATKPYERMLPPDRELYPRFDEQNPDEAAKIKAENEALKIEASQVLNYLPANDAKSEKSSFTRKVRK